MRKTAIVTGASSGIGRAIAHKLAETGINVVLVARNEDKLKAVAEQINGKNEGEALVIRTDISNKEEVAKMVKKAKEQFGSIDIFINNAGVMLSAMVTAGELNNWEQMIDVNIKGVLYGLHAIVPEMVERKTGHIINIASVSGLEVTKTSTVYSATKFAVRAISMGLEKELAQTGVKVTNISPGMVDTNLTSRISVTRKILEPLDVASAVIYAITQPTYVNINEITVRPV